jgi:hypothetical protein
LCSTPYSNWFQVAVFVLGGALPGNVRVLLPTPVKGVMALNVRLWTILSLYTEYLKTPYLPPFSSMNWSSRPRFSPKRRDHQSCASMRRSTVPITPSRRSRYSSSLKGFKLDSLLV